MSSEGEIATGASEFQEGEKSGRQDRPGIPSPEKTSHSHSLASQRLRDLGGATWAVPLAAPKPAGNRAAGPGRPFRALPELRARPELQSRRSLVGTPGAEPAALTLRPSPPRARLSRLRASHAQRAGHTPRNSPRGPCAASTGPRALASAKHEERSQSALPGRPRA